MSTDEPLLSEKFHGEVGNLGSGTLVITVPYDDKQDYRLYFFADKNGEGADPEALKLEEADYVFPDAYPVGRCLFYCMANTARVRIPMH